MFPPLNAVPVCSRWWCQPSRGTGGAGQEQVKAVISSPAAAQGCEHLQTAAWELWLWMLHHSCGVTWQRGTEPAPAWMFVMSRSQAVIPAFSYPPSPLPPCLGWQLGVFLLPLSLANSQLMVTGAKQTLFKSTSWNKIEDRWCSWDFLAFKTQEFNKQDAVWSDFFCHLDYCFC